MENEATSGEVIDAGAEVAPATAGSLPRGGIASFTVVFCLIVFLPGFFGLPVTNHEARFAQSSRQMYESVSLPLAQRLPDRHGGGLLIPRFQNRDCAGDGPLGHWLQSASAAVFSGGNPHRDAIWMYRIPSVLAAIMVVISIRKLGTSLFDLGVGRLAAVLLAVCPLVAWEARQATEHMMSLAFLTAAMRCLWGALHDSGLTPIRAVAFWLAALGGFLTGGLVVVLSIMLAALMICLVTRRLSWLRETRPVGVVLFAVAIGIWFYAAGSRVGFQHINFTFARELFFRDVDEQWPPGTHLVLIPILLWPGSLLIVTGLVVAWLLGVRRDHSEVVGGSVVERARLHEVHPGYLFLIAWIVPTCVLAVILPGKSPQTALLAFPAFAILGARALLAAAANALPGMGSRLERAWTVLWLVSGAGLMFATIGVLILRLVVWPSSTLGTAGAAFATALAALVMFRALAAGWKSVQKSQYVRAALAGAGVMLVAWIAVPTIALPRALGFATDVGAALDRIDPSGGRPIAAVNFTYPGLAFHTRGRLLSLDAQATSKWLHETPTGLIVREADTAPSLDFFRFKRLATVTGLDTRRWRAVTLSIEELER